MSQDQGPTLSRESASNAVVAVTTMYAGALADAMRENAMLRQQLDKVSTLLGTAVTQRDAAQAELKKLAGSGVVSVVVEEPRETRVSLEG